MIANNFQKKQIDYTENQNFYQYRKLDFRKDGDEFFAVDVKAQRYGKILQGSFDEASRIKEVFYSLSGFIVKNLKFVKWEEIEPNQIEEAKKYLYKNNPQIQNIQIQKTDFLVESGKYLYFPQFLREVISTDHTNQNTSNYEKLKPAQRKNLLDMIFFNDKVLNDLKRSFNIEFEFVVNFNPLIKTKFLILKEHQMIYKNKSFDIKNAVIGYKNNFGLGFNSYRSENKEIYIEIINTTFGFFQDNENQNLKSLKKELENYFHKVFNKVTISFSDISKALNQDFSNIEFTHKTEKFVEKLENKFKGNEFVAFVIHDINDPKYNLIYDTFKRIFLEKGIGSQFTTLNTILKNLRNNQIEESVLYNIFLGLAVKDGNIPFILSKNNYLSVQNNPIEIDYLIGYDVSRDNKNGKNRSFGGGVYFYSNQGRFKKSVTLPTSQTQGEVIREDEVKKLFPSDMLENKTIVLHRDGKFQAKEFQLLKEYFEVWNIKAHIIYITKNHNVRVFQNNQNPAKGVYSIYSENKAILVTSDSSIGTKRPLKIEYLPPKNGEAFQFEYMLEQINNLTFLNYASFQEISMPVTIHSAHKVSNIIRKGFTPHEKIKDKIFWI